MEYVSPIANPLITGKLQAKCLKMVKKAHGAKSIRRGVPETTKLIRKGNKGIVLLASNIFPVDLMAHMPILCEEKDNLYCYAASREELGTAVGSKRAVSVLFIPKPSEESVYQKSYLEFEAGLKTVHPYMGEGKPQEEEGKTQEKEVKTENTEVAVEEPAKKKRKKEKKAKAEDA